MLRDVSLPFIRDTCLVKLGNYVGFKGFFDEAKFYDYWCGEIRDD